jgi:serine/threonine protein phosphatase 1
MRRTYVIGDVHGCRQLLAELLECIRPDPRRDAIIILGDFINRGPDTKGTVALLLELRAKHRHLIVLRGNHEQMFLDYLAGRHQELFLSAGGKEMLASYGIDPGTPAGPAGEPPPDHLGFLSDLPTFYENEHGIYVHAGLEPGVHLTRQTPAWLLWARDGFINSPYDFGKKVIFGHTPFPAPLVEENKIGVDTGAVYGGRLTCLILPDQEFISLPGRRWWPRGETEG